MIGIRFGSTAVRALFCFSLLLALLYQARTAHLGCVVANNVHALRLLSAVELMAPDTAGPERLLDAQQIVSVDWWTEVSSSCSGNVLELSRAVDGRFEGTPSGETASQLRATSHFLLGLVRYDAGAHDDALSSWTKARAYKDTVILRLLPDTDSPKELIGLVRLLAPLEFSSNRGRSTVAQLMERSGYRQGASEIWAQAVAHEPETTATHWWYLGESRRLGGDLHGALHAYERGIPLTPDTKVFLQRITLLNMELGEWSAAEQAAISWRAASQNEVDALLASGHIAQNQLFYSEAEYWYSLAIKAAPTRGDAQYRLGHLRFSQHRYPDAVGYLTAAIDLQPDLDGAHALLVLSYLRLHLQSDAAQVLEQAEKRIPAFSQLYPGLHDIVLSGNAP